MRVDIVTLTTASAAALTIGLASPALGATSQATAGLHEMSRYPAHILAVGDHAPAHGVAHAPVLIRDGDDDGDGDGDDRDGDIRQGHCDGGSCGGFFHRGFHCSGFRCGGAFGLGGGPFAFGGGCGGGFCGGHGGGGTAISEQEGFIPGRAPERRKAAKQRPAMAAPRRQVRVMPTGPAPTGFGGGQGTNMPLGLAGLALILGGVGLVPAARRRIRASARS